MPAYLLTLDTAKCGKTLKNGCNAMAVFAASTAIAKEMAQAKFDGDGDIWNSALITVTEIVAGVWVGWKLRITVTGPDLNQVFEVTGTSGDNTMDEIAALMVTALNAHALIANASYDAATNILTVASIADGLGDHQLVGEMVPPDGYAGMPSLCGAIVDGGIAGAVLTIVLPLDAAVVPLVAGVFSAA